MEKLWFLYFLELYNKSDSRFGACPAFVSGILYDRSKNIELPSNGSSDKEDG